MMPVPVTIVADGGLPVSEADSGTPMTPTDGTSDNQPEALPITIVSDGGIPVVLVNDDLTAYVAP